jgi:methionine-rich copper-binding protein CopC/putative copper export protein/ABC-type branched-subunit amino acid transport system substrate-binding protein
LTRRGALAGAVLALAMAAPADAHPYLVASTPRAGVVATTVPSSIALAFTEALTVKGGSITVRDASGHRVHTGPLHSANGGDGMSVSTGKLPEGVYTINWVALGDDGHTVSGSFRVGVPSATGQAPPGAGTLLASTGANGTEQAPTESAVSIAGRWMAAVGAFVLFGGALLLLRLRGRVEPALEQAAGRRWRALALAALGIAVVGTVAEALERSSAPTGGISFSLLAASTTGAAVLVRLGVLLVCAVALRFVPARWRAVLLGTAGAVTLGALAIDGHVATVRNAPVLAAFGQIVHLVSVGAWIGGVLALAACVAPSALATRRGEDLIAAARAFTVIALPAAVLTIGTGIIAAVREARSFYFLRWTTYGHLVIAKVLIVAIVLGIGAATTLLARRRSALGGKRAGWLMRAEAVAAITAAAVASVLAGTLQGRGQPLPSQRGNLLPGAGFADVALKGAVAEMTLAPAQVAVNRIVVTLAPPANAGAAPPSPPRTVSVALSCACGGRSIGINVPLHPGAAGRSAWYADVGIPANGVWSAELKVDGRPTIGSPTFTVGVPSAPGSTPVTVASVADLSGPDAVDCRSQELGALYAIELMNIVGGVDGRKIVQVLLDDGGDPALARRDALALAARRPVAFLAPCGRGAQAAIQAVGNQVPTIVADDNVPVTQGRRVYRFAPDPYSEGYAAGQYIGKVGLPEVPKAVPRLVNAFVDQTNDSHARLRGLETALAAYGVDVRTYPAGGAALADRMLRLMPADQSLGIYLDGPFNPVASALRTVGHELPFRIAPTAIIVSSRLASERFVVSSGDLGSEGQIHALTDVDPASLGAQTYVTHAPPVVGELPTIPGLSGFVAGQALAYGMVAGTSPTAIAARLQAPGVFSRAAVSPWSDREPATGTLMFKVFVPVFLTSNLIPAPTAANGGAPGDVVTGQYFANGDWEGAGPQLFTPLPINTGSSRSGRSYLVPRRGTPSQGTGAPVVPPQAAPSGAP